MTKPHEHTVNAFLAEVLNKVTRDPSFAEPESKTIKKKRFDIKILYIKAIL